jgi:1-acyl-sn-glycerol-3-phosphate acyltransferase
MRNLVFFTLLWTSLLVSILLLIPYGLLFIIRGRGAAQSYAGYCTHYWGKFVVFISGSRITVENPVSITERPPSVILSNHQSYMDIPILMSIYPFPLSFIAKKDLIRMPFINIWILVLGCDLMDRRKPLRIFRKVGRELEKGSGKTHLFFPEGTRSKSALTGRINGGLIRIALDSGVTVQPVRIDGSYRIFEERGRITPAEVKVRLFKASDNYSQKEVKELISGERVN